MPYIVAVNDGHGCYLGELIPGETRERRLVWISDAVEFAEFKEATAAIVEQDDDRDYAIEGALP